MMAAADPPRPPIGSPRYFMLLYAPREQRSALATLLAIDEELEAGSGRALDPVVTTARLAWWREEATRFEAGEPRHPWLIALRKAGEASLAFTALVEAVGGSATAIDGGAALLLCAARQLHPAPLEAAEREALEDLGRRIRTLERQGLAAARTAHPADWTLAPRLQPPLAPLLVWAELTVHARHRQARRTAQAQARGQARPQAGARLDAVADNLRAWRTARRAMRRRFRLRLP